MILYAAFHRAFPSQLSLCTGAQLLSEVWSAPHAPGPRRPPGQQQPLRSPCPTRAVHAVGGRRAAAARAGSGAWLAEAGTPVGHDCRTPWAQDPLGAGRCP